jgi:hypothetical protein
VSSVETLRLLVGLLHPVRDSRAMLLCHNGQRIEVGHHPTAELSPCQLRDVVIACGRAGRPDYTALVASVEMRGSLEPIGGGLHRRIDPAGIAQRWFATLLPPQAVSELLDAVDLDHPDNAFEASIYPDCALGTTAVCVTVSLPECAVELDTVAFTILASCLVEELVYQSRRITA